MKGTKSGRRSRADRTPSADPGQRRAGVAAHLSGAISSAWAAATTLVGRVPGTLDATRTGARDAARSLQTLPDPTLRWLAAGSVGMSAGLFLTGKRRLVIAASIAPAVAMGAAILARPAERVGADALLARPAERVVAGTLVARPVEAATPEVLEPVTVVGPKRNEPWRAVSGLTRHGNGVKRG
jgi:hypothetical protein